MAKCAYCDEKAITELDGDNLCKRHADAWVKAEGDAAAEYHDCGGEGWFRTDDGAGGLLRQQMPLIIRESRQMNVPQILREFIDDCEKSFAAAQEYGDEITDGPRVLIDDVIYVPVTEIGGLLRKLANIPSDK